MHNKYDLIKPARVAAVYDDRVEYTTKDKEGKMETHSIPTNFALWSTSSAMNPFTECVSNLL